MASATRDLTITKSAYVKEASPTAHYSTNASTAYRISDDDNSGSYSPNNYLLFGFGAWPDSLKRNRLLGVQLRVYVKAGTYYVSAYMCDDFDSGSVTYKTHPEIHYDFSCSETAADLGVSVGSWADVWLPFSNIGASIASFLKSRACLLDGPMNVSGNTPWQAKTVLAGGGAPYIRVTYSDSEIETSVAKISQGLSGSVSPRVQHVVTWKLEPKNGYNCYDKTFTQASAVFYWKTSEEQSYHAIPVASSSMLVSIPAFTFPTGKTIRYYVSVTDTDGNTSSTSVNTFTTPASKITPQDSPTSGYKNPREDITFSWYFANTSGNYDQSSASLFWREAGTEEWTQVDAVGSTKSLTIPANTFPAASAVEWYLSGTDSSGSASQTEVYTFSTTASTAYAIVSRPVNSVEDGSKPITFAWTLQSADGLEMSQVDLWWKLPEEDNQHWHVIKSSTDIITEWTVDAGYFPAGEIEWLVHAYNIDGTRGPDSQSSFICVAAPDPVQGLTATAVPLTTIRWQSEGQEAYEISIDGEVVKKAYGVGVYSWKVPTPLEDGEHIISVRIQGVYGLWSQPSTTSIFVTNSPPWDMYLSGEFGADARLHLDLAGHSITPEDVHWYRDGAYIAWTTGRFDYTDRMVLGTHRYYAEIWFDDGNYIRSNDVIGKMSTDATIIALAAGGEWLDIGLSENSADVQQFSWSRTVALLHVRGSVYPIMETSPFEDLVGSYNCAFAYQDDAARFEALRGHPVIIKSRRGNVITGAIVALTKKETKFYTSYTFNVQRLQWEDFVRDDQTA